MWSDSAALELSNGSNGWFRFILDGKLATMYSSGSPENGNDNSGRFYFHTSNLLLSCGSIYFYPTEKKKCDEKHFVQFAGSELTVFVTHFFISSFLLILTVQINMVTVKSRKKRIDFFLLL